uniref:Macro domain-containing protein n=1 Tax=Dicentrarchus labrax TaxID=13489 RepID=A0A8C4DMJ6_DICLA
MDPHKIKSLLQSCSSRQTTDDVKVYTEFGFAVVVGELSQVKARLMDVEDRSRLGERTTTICRLGEAKLRLLWKEIEHSLGRDFPGVKVMQGDSGQLVLEGSVEEILKVLVCQGDITKQHADALVNAANEDLDHCGGVAAALSKAGGPEVQRESNALIKYIGKIPTGDVVVTTGGNLNCKILLHAVGPVGGKSGGNERALLKQTVQSALDLSEIMGFNSIAMPCISSGVFGVPVNVCSEAIVTALTARFGEEAKEETLPGDTVLVDGLPGLLSNAVFFINLVPWDDDEDGIAVQVKLLSVFSCVCVKEYFVRNHFVRYLLRLALKII